MKDNKQYCNKIITIKEIIYLILTVIFTVCLYNVSDRIYLWANGQPRNIQFVFLVSVVVLTIWQNIGHLIVNNSKTKKSLLKTVALVILNVTLFIVFAQLLYRIEVPLSMHFILFFAGIFDVIRIKDGTGEIHRLLITTSYALLGILFLYNCSSSVEIWDKNYSFFAHIMVWLLVFALNFCFICRKSTIISNISQRFFRAFKFDKED